MGRVLPRFDFRVDVAGETHPGLVRSGNEDAHLLAPEIGLFAVADGMGGLTAGDVASSAAIRAAREVLVSSATQHTVATYAREPTLEHRRAVFARLREAFEAAHGALVEEQASRKSPMGTTLDACLLVRDKAFVAHAGDGRVYLARPRAVVQLTSDHLGHEPASGARRARGPRPLSSAIGLSSGLRVDVLVVDLDRGDGLVLMTDGAYGAFESEGALAHALRGSASAITERVLKVALARGGRDNATVIVLKMGERLVARPSEARSKASAEPDERDDIATLQHCPLFVGLDPPSLAIALSAGIEVDAEPGEELKRFEAGDLCAYVVLDGLVSTGDVEKLGPPGLVYAESLVGVEKQKRAVALERARLLRVRRDDFREVAEHDTVLGLSLYQRLAGHLARH